MQTAPPELVAGKLTRIDDTPMEEAIARIRTILPQAESDVLLVAFTPVWLSSAEVMPGLGIIQKREDGAIHGHPGRWQRTLGRCLVVRCDHATRLANGHPEPAAVPPAPY